MANLIATVIDAADSMVRRLGGQRLCAFCQQWAKTPHKAGGLYFCDRIHASIYFNKQQEAMKKQAEAIKQAVEKKRALEKERQQEAKKQATGKKGSPEKERQQ